MFGKILSIVVFVGLMLEIGMEVVSGCNVIIYMYCF